MLNRMHMTYQEPLRLVPECHFAINQIQLQLVNLKNAPCSQRPVATNTNKTTHTHTHTYASHYHQL